MYDSINLPLVAASEKYAVINCASIIRQRAGVIFASQVFGRNGGILVLSEESR